MSDLIKANAPWSLKGKGYMILYRSTEKIISKDTFLPLNLHNKNKGGFSCIMLVDYTESNVGPYQELLFIPGKFSFNNLNRYTISKIYVSTRDSVVNGWENWAIPKELADFSFDERPSGYDEINVKIGNHNFFYICLKEKLFKFPITTSLLPFPLAQEKNGQLYLTKFQGKGYGKLASIRDCKINPVFFPDVSNIKHLIAIKIDPFKIQFPVPEIKNLDY